MHTYPCSKQTVRTLPFCILNLQKHLVLLCLDFPMASGKYIPTMSRLPVLSLASSQYHVINVLKLKGSTKTKGIQTVYRPLKAVQKIGSIF